MDLTVLFFKRYLFSKRSGAVVRTMARICWVATLIGIFALVLVSSIMNGFNRSIRTKLLGAEPHVTIAASAGTIEYLDKLDLNKYVKEKSRFARQDVIIRTLEGQFSGASARGLEEQGVFNFMFNLAKLQARGAGPSVFEPSEVDLQDNEIIIGINLAHELGVYAGDEVMLISPETLLGPLGEAPMIERMRIRTTFSSDFSEVDGKTILYRLRARPYRYQSDLVGERGLEFRMHEPNAHASLEKILAHEAAQVGAKPQDVIIESWASRNQALFYALKLEKAAMTTFLGLSVLIPCFSLITILLMLISQKRKEIGVLMALGMSRKQVGRLFMLVGVCLSGVGLFFGLFLGVLTSFIIDKYPLEIMPQIYYERALPAEINPTFVAGVAAFCVFVAYFAAFWPVRFYMKNTPADNLRKLSTESN